MTTFDPHDADAVWNMLPQLLSGFGHEVEASIVRAAGRKEFKEERIDSDWGITSIGYELRLELIPEQYVKIAHRDQCESAIKLRANEIFRAYENQYVESVSILVLTSGFAENLEPDYSKASRLLAQCLSFCTDAPYKGPGDYEKLRAEFVKSVRLSDMCPAFLRQCRSQAEFVRYMEKQFDGWTERSDFLRAEFMPLLEFTEFDSTFPCDTVISDSFSLPHLLHIQDVWQRCLTRRSSDPEGAITSARTLLETVCKQILEQESVQYNEKMDLPKLYFAVAERLNLAPSQHSEEVFKKILGSCQTIVDCLAFLRNKLSDAHGKGKKAARPAPRHAELAVNLAGAVSLFLLQTQAAKTKMSDQASPD